MHHESVPFSLLDIRSFVPEKVRPWILFSFFIIFQLSGGVYLAAVSEMSGSLALMQEDILMAGYASLVGLALTFTIMFRLKFRFSLKTSLLTTASGLIVCNLICLHTGSVPVLVATCFVAGVLRMWGTFACNSAIQLWVTPVRDMAVWFCYINLFVQGCIQFTGLVTIYVSFLTQWEYMHWLIIGLLFCLILVTFICFRHYRSMKKLPLKGIDWMGGLLWAATILCAIFVLNYGDYYDWFYSTQIWMGTIFGFLALGLNIWRASFVEEPYIALQTWRFRNVWLTFVLYVVVDILVSPTHLFEPIYTEGILGFDSLNVASIDWMVVLGTACGALFCYHTFALQKWTFKTLTLIGFSLIVAYLMIMYFLIDFNLSKEMLYFPIFLRGMGYVILSITFLTALSGIPFQNFSQSLTIQAFISACCGSLVGSAILTGLYKYTLKKNVLLLGANLDHVNLSVNQVSLGSLFGRLQEQAILVSMKEIYGWLCILGLFCLMAFFLKESSLRPTSLHPKFSTIRRTVKHQLKMYSIIKDD